MAELSMEVGLTADAVSSASLLREAGCTSACRRRIDLNSSTRDSACLQQLRKTAYSGRPLHLLQLRVFRLGFFQDGDVGVGILPKGEEVFIGNLGARGVARLGPGARETEIGQRAERKVYGRARIKSRMHRC
jgi:hypothetical protein